MNEPYEAFLMQIQQIGQLEATIELLRWDQETCMPAKATAGRAEQIALLAELAHQKRTSAEMGDLLSRLSSEVGTRNAELPGSELPVPRSVNIRETRRLYERAVRLPAELVAEISRTSTLAREAWVKARQDSDFPAFAPWLERLVALKRRAAELIGYADEPYDALLDEFEPGARTRDLAALFAELRDFLVPLVKAIGESPRQPDTSLLTRTYPRAAQEAFGRQVAEALGYDFAAGRLDVSTHPFTSGITPRDVRITTRYDERLFGQALFGTLHEVGHALYEQGLSDEHAFTPMGQSVSLGIHESQSRLWENQVGRSREFWEYLFPVAERMFPQALAGVKQDDFYAAVNVVRPSLIRVEADEVTYNLHIMMRFDLERELLKGRLAVGDVPEAWGAKMADLLGVRPPDDRTGCLQDIHWSEGIFGYFPTYTLGNLYAAQFFEQARRDLPDLAQQIRRGRFSPLLDWLRQRVHRHGQRHRADELVVEVTGRPLSSDAFTSYLQTKFKPLYGL